MKVLDEVKWQKNNTRQSTSLKEVWCTKFLTFHRIYKKFLTKTSPVTKLTDWSIQVSEKIEQIKRRPKTASIT